MKFLVDNQLPTALARWLTKHGRDAVHVLDVRMNETDDRAIWEYARAGKTIVITKDEDFSNRVAACDEGVQVIWVRLGNCRNQFLLASFEAHMSGVVSALNSGTSVVELWAG